MDWIMYQPSRQIHLVHHRLQADPTHRRRGLQQLWYQLVGRALVAHADQECDVGERPRRDDRETDS